MDNFFSGVQLFDDLRADNIGACGTVRANRKDLPSQMKTYKGKKGDVPKMWLRTDNKLIACAWQDTGKVNMISSVGNSGITKVDVRSKSGIRQVLKPNIQVEYNKFMGGVDLFDQLCSTYPFKRKNKKWHHVIWHFLVETALVNGYICYKIENPDKKVNQRTFRQGVIDGMLEGFSRGRRKLRGKRHLEPTTSRLVERHFPSHYNDKKKQPNCSVCSISPSHCSKKGKGSCKRKQTTYYCGKCPGEPPLCVVPCFEIYHSKKIYKKVCKCSE